MGMMIVHAQQKEVARSEIVPTAQTAATTHYSAHLRSNQEVAIVPALAPLHQYLGAYFAQ